MEKIVNQKILILGDSITHANKYVAFIQMLLAEKLKVYKPDMISIGLSSETASGLTEKEHPFLRPCVHDRLQKAFDSTSPDVVMACYGMNDAIYNPLTDKILQSYKNGIMKLIADCTNRGIKVILITPPYFDAPTLGDACRPYGLQNYSYMNPYEEYANVLEALGKWLMTLEQSGEVEAVVDVFHPLKEFVISQRQKDPEYKYGDGIHPCNAGHFIIAKTIFEKVFDYKIIENPTYIEKPESSPLFECIEKRCNLTSNAWRKYIGHAFPLIDETILPFDELAITVNKLNHQIMQLADNRLPGVTIHKGPADWQIIQRDAGGHGKITLVGTYQAVGDDISVQVRIVDENTGAPVTKYLDWTDAEINPNKNTFWIIVENIPQGGLYRIETRIRRTYSDSRPMRGDYIHHIGVGDIYVIAGQSNASGTGKGEACDSPCLGVHVFANDERWKLATHPLEDATGTMHPSTLTGIFHGTSPWLAFGKKIQSKTNIPIGLIPTALGGSNMAMWIDHSGEPSKLYINMIDMITKAGGTIAGILWYQGESDCLHFDKSNKDIYFESFKRFVESTRRFAGSDKLPVYIAQLNRFVNTDASLDFSEMRTLQQNISQEIHDVHMIVTIDLPLSDEIHISSMGNKILGERFAEAALAEYYHMPILWQFPTVESAKFLNDHHTKILVTFKNIRGDLTTGMCTADFMVESDEKYIKVLSARSQRDNTVIIELASNAQNGAILHCLQGPNPIVGLRDDAGRCLTPCSVKIDDVNELQE